MKLLFNENKVYFVIFSNNKVYNKIYNNIFKH